MYRSTSGLASVVFLKVWQGMHQSAVANTSSGRLSLAARARPAASVRRSEKTAGMGAVRARAKMMAPRISARTTRTVMVRAGRVMSGGPLPVGKVSHQRLHPIFGRAQAGGAGENGLDGVQDGQVGVESDRRHEEAFEGGVGRRGVKVDLPEHSDHAPRAVNDGETRGGGGGGA